MFDIGWQELIIVGVIAVIVMGPKELPRALRTVMGLVRKARSMAGEFQRGVDEMIREADIDDLRKDVESATQLDIHGEIERTIDPGGDLRKGLDMRDVEQDLEGMNNSISPPKSSPDTISEPTEMSEVADSALESPNPDKDQEPDKVTR